MSESSLSGVGPDDDTLEMELRQVVRSKYAAGKLEELTVRRVRAAAEKNLSLSDGFFKESEWKDRSKSIIEFEATKAANDDRSASSPARPRTGTAERAFPDGPKSSKRRRTGHEVLQDLKAGSSDPDDHVPQQRRHEVAGIMSSTQRRASKGSDRAPQAQTVKAEQSESELSELIDDDPREGLKKSKPHSKSAKPKDGEKKKIGRKKKDKAPDLDPDAEEIKRLQGWLIKCGIRKMWSRELKPYEAGGSRAKIRHLNELLTEAGMTGRYSLEKATQIRETRELQADLEAVQEGAKRWGKADEEEDGARPKRRLARGLEGLEFLDEQEDEDSN